MLESYASFEEDHDRKVTIKYDRKDVLHPRFLDYVIEAVAEVRGTGLAVEVSKMDEEKWYVAWCMLVHRFG